MESEAPSMMKPKSWVGLDQPLQRHTHTHTVEDNGLDPKRHKHDFKQKHQIHLC